MPRRGRGDNQQFPHVPYNEQPAVMISTLFTGLLATFYDDPRESTCHRTVILDSYHPFLGPSASLVTLMGSHHAGILIVF